MEDPGFVCEYSVFPMFFYDLLHITSQVRFRRRDTNQGYLKAGILARIRHCLHDA